MTPGAVVVSSSGAELVLSTGAVAVANSSGECPGCCGDGGGGGPGPCDVVYKYTRCALGGGSSCPDTVQELWVCCGMLEACMRAAGVYPSNLQAGAWCTGGGSVTVGIPATILYSGKCWQWAGVAKTEAELQPGDVLASNAFSCVRESDGQPFNGCQDPACPDSGGYVPGEVCACNPEGQVPAGPVYACASQVSACRTVRVNVLTAAPDSQVRALCFTFRPGGGVPADQLPQDAILAPSPDATFAENGCCGCCATLNSGGCTTFTFTRFAFCTGGGLIDTPGQCCSTSGTKTITVSGNWSNRLGDSGSGSITVVITFVNGSVVNTLVSGSASWTSGGQPSTVDFSVAGTWRPGGVFAPGVGCISNAADRDVLFELVAFIAAIGAPYTWNDPVNDCAAIAESYSAHRQYGQATLRVVDSQGTFATMTAQGEASYSGVGPCAGGCGGNAGNRLAEVGVRGCGGCGGGAGAVGRGGAVV